MKKNTLFNNTARTLRLEALENREMLSATPWETAAAADSAVVSAATLDDVIVVTTLDDVVADDDATSLREAIAAAQDGQTIVFSEDLANSESLVISINDEFRVVDKSIVINGAVGDQNVTIDAGKASRHFILLNSGSTIQNFNLINGQGTGEADVTLLTNYQYGGSIYVNGYYADGANGYTTGVKNLEETNAIAETLPTVTLDNIVFDSNTGANGGTIYGRSVTINVSNSQILHSTGSVGGALHLNSANGNLTNVVVDGSYSTSCGALEVMSGVLNIADSQVLNNRNDRSTSLVLTGAGVTYYSNINAWPNGTNIPYSPNGTDLRAYGTITNTLFDGNNNQNGNGGAIGTNNYVELTISGSTFQNNKSKNGGSGIYTTGAKVEISDTVFKNNTTDGNGAAIYASFYNITRKVFDENGTAIVNSTQESVNAAYTLNNVQFIGNTAKKGAAIYADSNNAGFTAAAELNHNVAATEKGPTTVVANGIAVLDNVTTDTTSADVATTNGVITVQPRVSKISETKYEVSWDNVENATGYKVKASLDGGATWSSSATLTTNSYQKTFSAGKDVSVRLWANVGGKWKVVGETSFTTTKAAVAKPVVTSFVQESARYATLSWSSVDAASSYVVKVLKHYTDGSKDDQWVLYRKGVTDTELRILTSSSAYSYTQYRVYAANEKGTLISISDDFDPAASSDSVLDAAFAEYFDDVEI